MVANVFPIFMELLTNFFFFLGLLKLSGYICCFMTLNLSLRCINGHFSMLIYFNMSILVIAFGWIRHGGIYG